MKIGHVTEVRCSVCGELDNEPGGDQFDKAALHLQRRRFDAGDSEARRCRVTYRTVICWIDGGEVDDDG